MNRCVIIETVTAIGLDDRRLQEIAREVRDIIKAGGDSTYETRTARERYLEDMRQAFSQQPVSILAAIKSSVAIERYATLIAAMECPARYEQHCGREFLESLRFVIMNPLPDPPPPCRDGETIFWQLPGEDRLLAAICLHKIGTTDALAVLEQCEQGDSGLVDVIDDWQGSIKDTQTNRKTLSDGPLAPVEQSAPVSAVAATAGDK